MAKKSEGTKTGKPMDKPKDKSVGQLDESPEKMDESVNKSVDKSVISIRKYLQLHGSSIHKYTQAYIEVEYRGIMKAEEDWKVLLKEYTR